MMRFIGYLTLALGINSVHALAETCRIPYAGYLYGNTVEEQSSKAYRSDTCQPTDTDYVDPEFTLAAEPVVENNQVTKAARPPGWNDLLRAFNRGHVCVCRGAADNTPPIDSMSLPEDGRAQLMQMITQFMGTCGKIRAVVDTSGKAKLFCDETINVYDTQTGAVTPHMVNYFDYWVIPPKNALKTKRVDCSAQNGKPLKGPAILKYLDRNQSEQRYSLPADNANRVGCVSAALPPWTPRVSQILTWIPFEGAPVYQNPPRR